MGALIANELAQPHERSERRAGVQSLTAVPSLSGTPAHCNLPMGQGYSSLSTAESCSARRLMARSNILRMIALPG
jgi:hypothetical protein